MIFDPKIRVICNNYYNWPEFCDIIIMIKGLQFLIESFVLIIGCNFINRQREKLEIWQKKLCRPEFKTSDSIQTRIARPGSLRALHACLSTQLLATLRARLSPNTLGPACEPTFRTPDDPSAQLAIRPGSCLAPMRPPRIPSFLLSRVHFAQPMIRSDRFTLLVRLVKII